jgi:hypothetical protein
MSIVTGLDSIRKKIDSRPGAGNRVDEKELTRNLKKGESRKIRFLQELDTASPLYDEKFGLGLVVSEYQHPNVWWLRLVDTSDDSDGQCWPLEQGWESKLTLYVNVVDVETNEIFYLSRSVLGGIGKTVIDSALERGKLTDIVWKVSKSGEGMKTRYEFVVSDFTSEELGVSPDALVDFRTDVLREVPYEEQEKFVREIEGRIARKRAEDSAGVDAPASKAVGDDDDVW